VIDFEVHYREATDDEDADWTVLPRVSAAATSFTIDGLEEGNEYEIRVRTVDELGSATDWVTTTHLVEAPERELPNVVDVAITDGDCLSWRLPVVIDHLAGYEIRHAPGDVRLWEAAEPAHEGLWPSAPFPLCGVPGGERTFLVVAVDEDGNRSPTPAVLIDTPKPFAPALTTVLTSIDKGALGFPGVILGGTVAGGKLTASADSDPPLWPVGVGDAVPLWDVTPTAPLWDTDPDADLWKRRRGGIAPLWNFDPAASLWGDRFQPVVYTTPITVTMAAALAEARLTLDIAATPPGWRVEYRRPTGPLWTGPGTDLWDDDVDAPLWKIYGDAWVPWPGKLERVGPGLHEFRVSMPGGTTPAQLSRFVVALTTS